MQAISLVSMLIREWTSGPRVARQPEPEGLMDSRSQVDAFHAQGATALVPVYHFNALAACSTVRRGGTVVDLGSGSGQYLGYLARCRPDLRIIGIELAPTMVEVGRDWLAGEGLAGRVDLRTGDMTAFADTLDERVDLVSSVFSLHHLPTAGHVQTCLAQIRRLRERSGCGFWVFDHTRPRHPATPGVFPEIFTPLAAPTFKADSTNSLKASWTFDELCRMMTDAGLGDAGHWRSRVMPLYQAHRQAPRRRDDDEPAEWRGPALERGQAAKDFQGLQWLFPALAAGR